MSSGYEIHTEKFSEYCKNTAILYVNLYSWYNMPASLHRILVHGPEIIKKSPLPIGMYSEEALESRNKDFRKYRESFSRKFSRDQTMYDVFCRLLISSDPFISSISECVGARSNKEPLSNDVIELLREPDLTKKKFESSDLTEDSASESDDSD